MSASLSPTARELYDVARGAEYLATSERHVRRLIYERRIPYLKVGRKVRLDRRDLDAWLDAHRVPAEAGAS